MIYDGQDAHAYGKKLQKFVQQFKEIPKVRKYHTLIRATFFSVFITIVACSFVSIANGPSYSSRVIIKCYGQVIYPDSLQPSLPQPSPPQPDPFSWFNIIWTLVAFLSHVCTIISAILAIETYRRLRKRAIKVIWHRARNSILSRL